MGWIGVDFDGTLAKHETGDMELGSPVPAMLERVKGWIKEGREVRIMTARAHKVPEHTFFHQRQMDLIQDWCERHGLPRLMVTCEKDYQMLELWDDRAVGVVVDTGIPVGKHEDALAVTSELLAARTEIEKLKEALEKSVVDYIVDHEIPGGREVRYLQCKLCHASVEIELDILSMRPHEPLVHEKDCLLYL